MRLKEIKPGMAIHCENQKELNILLEEAERLGYSWTSKYRPTQLKYLNCATIHFEDDRHITWSSKGGIKFSDIVLSELTPEEVQKICMDICEASPCKECPMEAICYRKKDVDYEKIVEICAQWKADHENKDFEFEWVDICRIIKVHPGGRKKCVYEEDVTERELPFDGWPEPECAKVLKKYIAEHEGEYFAVASRVCRVKEQALKMPRLI